MLGVVGIVTLRMLTRRLPQWSAPWLQAPLIGVVIYAPVVVAGMFSPGTPWLDLAIGAGITGIFVVMIVRFGLLATTAALATHFILLRAPLTTDFSSWRGPLGLWYLAAIALFGFGAVYVGRTGARSRFSRSGVTSSARIES
jgi:hypothetical protein